MYYLVCYKLETAVEVADDVDPANLTTNCCPRIKKFLKKVGTNPIVKIDKKYPSYRAVMDNFHIIGKTSTPY